MFSHWIAGQFKRPEGLAGKIVGRLMEKGNLPAIGKTIESLSIRDNDSILEIGFGPGIALFSILSNIKTCTATGIDFSKTMYGKAYKRNIRFINEGRLALLHGDFCAHSFPQGSFSKIFGVNVIYFWSDIDAVAAKLYPILKPEGTIVFFMASKQDLEKLRFPKSPVFNKYEVPQVTAAFTSAGFPKVWHTELRTKNSTAFLIHAAR